ncbi:hypothetical protein [Azospirillum sp. sgz302134]
MTKLYRKLEAIKDAHPHLLAAYKRDFLVHDRRKIRSFKPGERWLWLLRNYGTIMFPIGAGQNPIWVTHHLAEYPQAVVALITVTEATTALPVRVDGTVQLITHDKAMRLAKEPPPKDRVVMQPALFGARLERNGHEIGSVTRYNDTLSVTFEGAGLGGFKDWTAALAAIEAKAGHPLGPVVGA